MHTQGPWEVTGEIDRVTNGEWIRPTGGNKSPICSIWDFNRTDREDERKANAALIAASPELLEALKDLAFCARTFRNVPKDEQEWTSIDDDALSNAFKAIEKAGGEV